MVENQDWNSQLDGAEDFFRETLRVLMRRDGLTQLDLSAKLGVRQSQVSNWLNGKSLPGYYSIKVICEKLNISADTLLDVN